MEFKYDKDGYAHFDAEDALLMLKESGQHPDLTDLIDRYSYMLSAHTDLKRAEEAVDRFKVHDAVAAEKREPDGRPDHNATIDAQAMVYLAVALYCRSTFSEVVDGRNHVFGDSWLNKEERAAHRRVQLMRDKVLMHYGTSNGGYTRPWNSMRRRYRTDGQGMSVFGLSGGVNYSTGLMHEIGELLKVVIPKLEHRMIVTWEKILVYFEDAVDQYIQEFWWNVFGSGLSEEEVAGGYKWFEDDGILNPPLAPEDLDPYN